MAAAGFSPDISVPQAFSSKTYSSASGSLDGSYVDRELVDSALLANGDEIQMGKFRLMFLTTFTTA